MDIKSMTLDELKDACQQMGEKPFRAKQLYDWMHHRLAGSYDEMTNLSLAFREKLKEQYPLTCLEKVQVQESKIDGTRKYLFRLSDGNVIESVWMKYHHGNSVCISSQVGCRMGCRFCASTLDGLTRNLRPSEMLDQIYRIQRSTGERVSNVVVMGSGEPMDNYDNVLRFLHLVSAPEGICISLRNVSVSTCGLCDRIDRLAEENLPITLSISLHAPTDEARRRIMPVANKYGISRLMESCRNYVNHTGRRIVFEYALIEGVNTALEDADQLAALTRGLLCHVNLIPLNDVPERSLRAPGRKGIDAFQHRLEELGVSVTRRREMGADIEGACGQLRRKHLSTEGS